MKQPLDTRGKRAGSTRGLALSVVMLLLFSRTALDLCASKACRSLICAARGSATEQKDLSPGCFTEVTSVAARLPLSQAAARAGGAPACEVNLTKTAVSGRISDFHCLRCSAVPAGTPAPLPGPARWLQRAPERRAGAAAARAARGQGTAQRRPQRPESAGQPPGSPPVCHGVPRACRREPPVCYEKRSSSLRTICHRCCCGTRAGAAVPGGEQGFTAPGDRLHLGTGCTPKQAAINTLAQPAPFLTQVISRTGRKCRIAQYFWAAVFSLLCHFKAQGISRKVT